MRHPLVKVEWEPIQEGIELNLNEHKFSLDTITVRELRDDMEEANMLSRGYSKIEEWAEDVLENDKIVVCSHIFTVTNVLEDRRGSVLQFSEVPGELVLPADEQITVWRIIE